MIELRLVENIPETALHLQIREENSKDVLTYFKDEWVDVELPVLGYGILGFADQITESEWSSIVDRVDGGYACYDLLVYGAPYQPLTTAKESGLTILRKQKMNPSTTVVLVKVTSKQPT